MRNLRNLRKIPVLQSSNRTSEMLGRKGLVGMAICGPKQIYPASAGSTFRY